MQASFSPPFLRIVTAVFSFQFLVFRRVRIVERETSGPVSTTLYPELCFTLAVSRQPVPTMTGHGQRAAGTATGKRYDIARSLRLELRKRSCAAGDRSSRRIRRMAFLRPSGCLTARHPGPALSSTASGFSTTRGWASDVLTYKTVRSSYRALLRATQPPACRRAEHVGATARRSQPLRSTARMTPGQSPSACPRKTPPPGGLTSRRRAPGSVPGKSSRSP